MSNSSIRFGGLALALSVAVSACAAPNNAATKPPGVARAQNTRGASVFDQLDAARRTRSDAVRTTPVTEQEKKLEAIWARFLADDPAWTAEREEWLRGGPAAQALLVENLLRTMVLARDAGDGRRFHRCRDELVLQRELATSYLVEALASGRGDSVTRNLCAETLAFFGESTVAAISAAWPDAATAGRRALLVALKLLRSSQARGLLEQVALSREDFTLRIEALDGLAKLADVASTDVCVACLEDADPSVRKFAAIAASHIGPGGGKLLPAVLAAWRKAEAAREIEVVNVLHRSARRLAGREYGADPTRWPVEERRQ